MAYKMNDNTERFLSEQQNRTRLALRFALEDIHRESKPKTPKRDGSLSADVKKSVRGKVGKIRWGRKYAGAQEAGQMTVHKTRTFQTKDGDWITLKPGVYKFRNYTTPGTGKHFVENAVRKVASRPGKYFRMAGA